MVSVPPHADVRPPHTDRMSGHIVSFDSGVAPDIAFLGGKCASLAIMTAAGIPVPPGFAITTEAYAAMLDENALTARITAELAGLDEADLAAVERAGANIREMIVAAPLPAAVAAAVDGAYAALALRFGEDVPVAVRSSATAEDLPNASFAGQQDTYLWVIGAESVRAAVKKCWASLFNARALSYRTKHGVAHRDVRMAVGVQKMVNARVAGVAMTLDPLTGDRSKIVIDASWGVGEIVVSGEVTPDNYVVDKVMLTTIRSRLSEKHEELVVDPAGRRLVRRAVETARRSAPCLTPEELVAVARLAKAAEKHYRAPQDVEWAIDGDLAAPDNVVLLQARPETVWSRVAPKVVGPAQTFGVESVVSTLMAPLASRKSL